MVTDLLYYIATLLLLVGTVLLVIYTVRLRKSRVLEDARIERSSRELEKNAARAEAILGRLENSFASIESWIREPLPQAERSIRADRAAHLLYEELELLLDYLKRIT